jgi:hypothetical protein
MTNTTRLKVSLTKHGVHKLATLLRAYDKDKVLAHLTGAVAGINIELAQAQKTLSVDSKGVVPKLWNDARALGDPAIDALVLVAVISSHHAVMDALINGKRSRPGTGVIKRDVVVGGKAFTNVAHVIEQLGYSTQHLTSQVKYDFNRFFSIPKLNGPVSELLALRLQQAGWDQKNDLVDELVAIRFHEVLSVSEEFFRDWIAKGDAVGFPKPDAIEDEEFFSEVDEDEPSTPFRFTAGHKPKKTGVVDVSPKSAKGKARLLHNEIQTKLFNELVKEFGIENVGSEVASGHGATAIDLVVKTAKSYWFYEIKTAPSVKACIRQAIPQLLEYAYWDGKRRRCERLIIVGPKPITSTAESYLSFLRKSFGIELYYLDCQRSRK